MTATHSNTAQVNTLNRLLSIAPMLKCTDRHFRYFARLFSQNSLLYTEMVTTGAILHGKRDQLLGYAAKEHPLALQLGGSDIAELAACAAIAAEYGYDEINLNVGCPSDRVQAGRFGVCLMREPQHVADCVAAMQANVAIPVTVKTRIGVDHDDSYAFLQHFIDTVASSGCQVFILHARKAWLKGLSPKQNRDIPPLNYARVTQLKRDFPHLTIILNGGLTSVTAIKTQLQTGLNGIMIGRAAYQNPCLLLELERHLFNNHHLPTRAEILLNYLPYLDKELHQGTPVKQILRHLVGLWQGQPGAKHWRRLLSEHPWQASSAIETLKKALDEMQQYVHDEASMFA